MSHYRLNFSRSKMYEALGIKSDKMPADFEFDGVLPCHGRGFLIGNFPIIVKKTGHGMFHRIFMKCKCGRHIPIGRTGQHKCEHWPTPEALARRAS